MPFIPDLANALNSANSYTRADGTTGPRVPMLLTCSMWQKANLPPIALRINPHSVTFKQAKRVTKRNTQGGTVYFHWSDENGQNNDVLEISFNGRTGNINLQRSLPPKNTAVGQAFQDVANWISGSDPEGSDQYKNQGGSKLFTWSRLYMLTRMPMIDTATGEQNLFQIVYRSPLFPRPLRLTGFFNNVLDFGENAENPFLVDWSFTYVVQSTYPDLDSLSDYLARALSDQKELASDVNYQIRQEQARDNSNLSATSVNFKNG
jgi:hypothetical protein